MRVHLISFGSLKSLFAAGGEWCELPEHATAGQVLRQLTADGRLTPAAMRSAAVAINQNYAKPDDPLKDGDELAILPPVSGGSSALIQLVREPIDTAAIQAAIKAAADGAVCSFDGVVRNNTRGRETLHLDYEAYEEMALSQMHGLREQAIANFSVREVAIIHRLGRLTVGETSVLIVVASAHRAAAFDACRWLIDTLKKTVPIWKREQFIDGAVWADGEPFPADIVAPSESGSSE